MTTHAQTTATLTTALPPDDRDTRITRMYEAPVALV
jgi:hypothetical protein